MSVDVCMMMSMGQFDLQWNDFGENLISSCKDFREEDDLCDVTLACDDDQLKAHKIILSSGSTFFKSVFKRNPHANPLLYLRGVKIEELRSMLDFMYTGRTQVAQDNVQNFLAIGRELGIKGLVEKVQEQDELMEQKKKDETIEQEYVQTITEELEKKSDDKKRQPRKMHKNVQFDIVHDDVKVEEPLISENMDFSFETEEHFPHETVETGVDNIEDHDVSTDFDVETRIDSLLKRVPDNEGKYGWQCIQCNKFSKSKTNLKKHVEIHIEGLSFPCKYCDKICKTRNSLNLHTYTSKSCKSKRMFEH